MSEEQELVVHGKMSKQLFPPNNERSENGYYIYGIVPESEDAHLVETSSFGNFVVKGTMMKLSQDVVYPFVLEKSNDRRGGYDVVKVDIKTPLTESEERTYLKTIFSEKIVNNLYDAYPVDFDNELTMIKMLMEDNIDHENVKGLGKKTLIKMKNKITETFGLSQLIAFLGGIATPQQISAIFRYYGGNVNTAIYQIEANPYVLTSIGGLGFSKVDHIALGLGVHPESPNRIEECIKYVLKLSEQNGNTIVKKESVLDETYDLLKIGISHITPIIHKYLLEDGLDLRPPYILIEGKHLAITNTYKAELEIAEYIVKVLKEDSKSLDFNETEFAEEQEEALGVVLTEEQKSIFKMFKENRFGLIVGNAGTGKTFGTQAIIALCKKQGLSTRLVSPTGKASKVLSNYTGEKATTIHMAIQPKFGEEDDDAVAEIWEDVILMDEGSMTDVVLFSKLLKAIINPTARLYIIGDDFQLPSVGAGRLLYDLLASDVPRVKLTQVFRQQEGALLNIATKIRNGEEFVNNHDYGQFNYNDTILYMVDNTREVQEGFSVLYDQCRSIYEGRDIVTLSPTKKGDVGTQVLNQYIQSQENPIQKGAPHRMIGETIFQEGDQIINTKNVYSIQNMQGVKVNIFNGDTGVISEVSDEEVVIEIDGDLIPFTAEMLTHLLHSYALTVHKSQGSQYPVAFVIIDKSHSFQLNANLLYTAITRAQKQLVLIGNAEVINSAIKRQANLRRDTMLQTLIKNIEK